jgi:hypothetical protein
MYNKTVWVNESDPGIKPDIDADNLNNIEEGIEAIYNGAHNSGASSIGTDSYKIEFANPFTSLVTNIPFTFKADVSNTGASTLQVDSTAAKAIKRITAAGKVDTATGDIIAGGYYNVVYDGTDYILINPLAILASLGTTAGDLIKFSGASTPIRVGLGTANQVFKVNNAGNDNEYGSISATGSGQVNQSLAATSEVTISLALGIYASKGSITLHNNNLYGATIHFNKTSSQSFSIAHEAAGGGALQCYFRSGNSQLSGKIFINSAGPTQIYIKSCVINGTNLDITFKNDDGSSHTIFAYYAWGVSI